MSLDDILDEIEASDGEMVLVDENGRRMMGDGVVEMLAGAMGSRSVLTPSMLPSPLCF